MLEFCHGFFCCWSGEMIRFTGADFRVLNLACAKENRQTGALSAGVSRESLLA